MEEPTLALVVGADGQIGGEVVRLLHDSGRRTWATVVTRTPGKNERHLDLSRDVIDLQSPPASEAFLCAAVTSMEQCRKDPAGSRRVNVDNTVALADRIGRAGGFVVFPSTSQVFDGRQPLWRADEPSCPVTEYGRQKAEAERLLAALGDRVAIVRLTKVLGPGNPLVMGWVRALWHGETIRPFSNMVMAPVPLSFAAEVLVRVGERRLSGVTQVSADRDVSYAEAAFHVARVLGVSSRLVQPVTVESSGIALEANPRHTTLDTTRLREEVGMVPPDAWAVLEAAVKTFEP